MSVQVVDFVCKPLKTVSYCKRESLEGYGQVSTCAQQPNAGSYCSPVVRFFLPRRRSGTAARPTSLKSPPVAIFTTSYSPYRRYGPSRIGNQEIIASWKLAFNARDAENGTRPRWMNRRGANRATSKTARSAASQTYCACNTTRRRRNSLLQPSWSE